MSLSNIVAHLSDPVKHTIDYFAVGAFVVSLLVNIMPVVTAFLTALWLILRLVEGWYSVKLKRLEYRERK